MVADQQLISGALAYALPGDLFDRFDVRVIADWISINGNRVGADAQGVVDISVLGINAKVLAGLQSGSGKVESVAFQGQRYSPVDLRTIADSTTNAAALLKDLVCIFAMVFFGRHRISENKAVLFALQEAKAFLEDLLQGKEIFAMGGAAAAGALQSQQMTQCEEYQRFGMSVQYEPFLGQPSDRTWNPYLLGG